jgi:hypothetical protein
MSTQSARSEILRRLSQYEVRLQDSRVNAKLIISFLKFLEFADIFERDHSAFDSVDVKSHSALTQSIQNETPRQLSQCRMIEILNISANLRI